MGMMVYTGTSDLTLDGAYGRETYTAYNGRSTPRCFVDESCEVVEAHPLLFRRAHASEGARSRGERDCIRSNIGGLTIPFDVIRLRDVDPALYEELRQAVLRLKEENPPTAEDKTNTGPHLVDGALHNLVHAHRHGERLEAVKNDPAAVSFNAEHCTHHIDGALDHLQRFIAWRRENVDGFEAEYAKIEKHLAGNGNGTKPPKPDQSKSAAQVAIARREKREPGLRHRRRSRSDMRRHLPLCEVSRTLGQLRVRITAQARDQLLSHVRSDPGLETGGLLFTRSTVFGPLVIDAVSGPGASARLSSTSMIVDEQHDRAICDRMAAQNLTCTGHWHSHPMIGGASLRQLAEPSETDRRG